MSPPRPAQFKDFMRDVGSRLRTVREQRRLSLREAAEKASLSEATIGSYERAERAINVPALVHLAGVYGVSPVALLPGVPLVDPVQAAADVAAVRAVADRIEAAVAMLTDTPARCTDLGPVPPGNRCHLDAGHAGSHTDGYGTEWLYEEEAVAL